MNARTQPPAGRVTVAEAAAALTREGDPIDPSNVSRYLARWPDVPSEKRGKFRYVDLAALRRHRKDNVLSSEKREAREDATAAPLFQAAPAPIEDEDYEEQPLGVGPEIQRLNLRLKALAVREKERADALAEGELVPLPEVVAIASGAMATFVTELERAEQAIAGVHGREVATAFRKARKAAQTAAAARMVAVARELAHPAVPAALLDGEAEATAAA